MNERTPLTPADEAVFKHDLVKLIPHLRAFARSQLAAYKVPKYVTVLADFPRTAAGKVQKHLLRRALAATG